MKNLQESDHQNIRLTKREHFAGRALQGLIANCYFQSGISIETHVMHAVLLADALIAELERKEEIK